MVSYVETGVDEGNLNRVLLERFNPGQKVDLRFDLTRELSPDELQTYADYLYGKGVEVGFVEMSGPQQLRVAFTRPPRAQFEGVGFVWSLGAILITGVLALGFIGIISWGITRLVDSITKNIVSLLAIGVGGFLIYRYMGKTPARS
ncbi:MAG TPA: hypothetical protein VMW00_06355 [Dehalococcoidales bacterium]|nr:hypothetical protein [Dehalococcoidales bacterium]